MRITLIPVILLLFGCQLLVPKNVYAQNLNNFTFDDLGRVSKKVASQDEYQAGMAILRQKIKEKLLGNIWAEYQKNPQLMLGSLSAKELFEKLEQFNLYENPTKLILQADSERKSDFYAQNQNWGVANSKGIQASNKKAMILLPLHIFCGAAGWEDENYNLSLALILYNESLNPAEDRGHKDLRSLRFEKFFPTTENLIRKSLPVLTAPTEGNKNSRLLTGKGGFTGVGGGGDDYAIVVKLEMLRHLFSITSDLPLPVSCHQRWLDTEQFVTDVQNIEIESRENVTDVQKELAPNGRQRVVLPRIEPGDHMEILVNVLAMSSLIHLCEIQDQQK